MTWTRSDIEQIRIKESERWQNMMSIWQEFSELKHMQENIARGECLKPTVQLGGLL